jgi:multidrug efflux pump
VFSRFFIDRPIFASVLSIVITLGGLLALTTLPLAQFPRITPPTVQVQATYPGASAADVADAVASPIEQEVNGVEGMMYMSSQCTNDGSYNLTVTFKQGVDLNMAQVLVQNRVSLAMAKLPDVIKQAGVTTLKRSPDIVMGMALMSPNGRYNQLYLSNYALRFIKDELGRVEGVSDVFLFGQRDFSMRIWVDPDKLSGRGLTATDVVNAIREQNNQVATGMIGQPPMRSGQELQFTLDTRGRLKDVAQFEDIILRATVDGRYVKIKDVARVELGPKNQDVSTRFDGQGNVFLAIFQLPDANALDTADRVIAKMNELRESFPEGIDYDIAFDTTPYTRESILEVFKTLRDAIILVALVVLLFLQNWRSAIIPLVAVPVAVVGTFAVMAAFGFSLNNLTLFGLVLAIGIVVDDAIVVVEAVEHHIEHGLAPREATIKAMEQVSGPVIAVGLVLSAVFIPCAFISGITGQFFRQFALTISASTIISAFNSLTLSPALTALLLRPLPKEEKEGTPPLPRLSFLAAGAAAGYWFLAPWLLDGAHWLLENLRSFGDLDSWAEALDWGTALLGLVLGAIAGWIAGKLLNIILARIFYWFNWGFKRATAAYTWAVGHMLAKSALVLVVYGGMLVLTYGFYQWTPRGFIPSQDMGYLMVAVQLPDAASMDRTNDVMKKLTEITLKMPDGSPRPGIRHATAISGQSFAMNAIGSNFGSMFINLKDYADRRRPELSSTAILEQLNKDYAEQVFDAEVKIFPPPPVRGVGRAGGFAIMIEDRGDRGPEALQKQVEEITRMGMLSRMTVTTKDGKTYEGGVLGMPVKEIVLAIDGKQEVIPAENIQDNKNLASLSIGTHTIVKTKDGGKYEGEVRDIILKEIVLATGGNQEVTILGEDIQDKENHPKVVGVLFSVFRANVPQVYVEANRDQTLNRSVNFKQFADTLNVYQGSLYVNDFNLFDRTWQVIVQADGQFRDDQRHLSRLATRNAKGNLVPLGSLASVRQVNGPLVLTRYNMYPAATINGMAMPNISSQTAIDFMQKLAESELSRDMAYEWTDMSYLELLAGNTAMIIFAFAVVMVFLVLAAQYESWSLPLAVILVVPMCLLSAIAGVKWAGLDINIFTQIGFVVLVGLASKNAILIVEYAKRQREGGTPRREATLAACQLRLRPIIMTSFAFILGVVPLMFSKGAGFEMRKTLGTAVFSGMLGVTIFGIFLTPVFFYVIDRRSQAPFFATGLMKGLHAVSMYAVTLGLQGLRALRSRRRTTPVELQTAIKNGQATHAGQRLSPDGVECPTGIMPAAREHEKAK